MKTKIFIVTFFLLMFGVCVHGAEGRYLIKLSDSVRLFDAENVDSAKDYISVSSDELQEYIDAGVVEYYEPDYEVVLFEQSWNQQMVNTDFLEKTSCVGTGVKIAVIDSGYSNGCIDELVLEGYNYLDDCTNVTDTERHGTNVSFFASSVAGDCRIVPLKCFDNGRDTYISNILDAIVDAVDIYDCDVINMSFGISEGVLEGDKKSLRLFGEKIKHATDRGAIVVAAVGNDRNSTVNYPAAFDNVIGVGAVDRNGERAEFSNYNNTVHVVAPGKNLSSHNASGLNGTSFAAPHVSGLAAVAKSIEKDISYEKFAQILAETAVETEADKVDGYDREYGYGLVDGHAMVKKLIEGNEIFIAPIQQQDKQVSSVFYNNTARGKKVRCICVFYDESGRMTKCETIDIPLKSDEIYNFKRDFDGKTVVYMAWDAENGNVPLSEARESNVRGF